MRNDMLINKLSTLIKPIVEEKDLELYYVEYVKEAGENYLRIYIDRPEGISLEDCEKVSRAVSDLLDVEDPIPDAYYLEVSSPGIDRILHTDEHLTKYIGNEVNIKLNKLFNGKKKFEGSLISFTSNDINIKVDNEEISVPRDIINVISLKGEL